MKILIVTQYFFPESASIPNGLASGLTSRGHDVEILTGYPNYPTGVLYPGYRMRWRKQEVHEGADVTRVPLYPNHSQSTLKRILNYASFAFTSSTVRRAASRADVVYVYATQMTAAFGPWLWRLTGGPPYVLHVQDLWPESVIGSSLVGHRRQHKVIAALLNPWLRSVYRRSAGVIGIAPGMVKTLTDRGARAEDSHLVFNWADSEASPAPTALDTRSPTTRVIYAGNVGGMQDLPTAVRAAHAASDCGVELVIVGDGILLPSLKNLARELGVTNVMFEGRVAQEAMPNLNESAAFALVSLKKLAIFEATIPSKFQSALAAGLPVISTVQGDVRSLVEENRVGLTAESEDVESLATAFRVASKLSSRDRLQMSRRARGLYDSRFSRDSGVSQIETLLVAAAKEGTTS